MTYETVKLYDCQKLPKEVKEELFKSYESRNDSIVGVLVYKKGTDVLSDYLINDGAEWDDTIYIKYWW